MKSIEQQYQDEIDLFKGRLETSEECRNNLFARIGALEEVLENVRELIDTYVDVNDGTDGLPIANKAMRAVQLIDEIIPVHHSNPCPKCGRTEIHSACRII